MIDRRDFLKTTGLGTGAMFLPGLVRSANKDRPNILWLVSEDNSPWLGCYGDEFATTPNLDKLAGEGVRFTNAFANTPVCAPARFTIHTGVYASSAGTEHMRSCHPIPEHIKFFTHHLRQAGYFCVNGSKTDYNTTGTPKDAWDDRRLIPSLKRLNKKQPFFCFINYMTTHESSMHKTKKTNHDPDAVKLAPYHPDTPEVRHDYAQYYDQIEKFDGQIGKILRELEQQGLAEDTIVFYFSDHGGVLPRSKRFLYDSGMHVPMIARFPEKYRHLAPSQPGSTFEEMVSFVDLAPTMLSIAGAPIPDYMQGRAFLGHQVAPGSGLVFGFRGRMDEVYDLSRAVRDKRFKYIRNYMPHIPWGKHNNYLWKMPAMQSWEEEYKAGRLNPVQARFFGTKPAEELYDVLADPYEINNLADDPNHEKTLNRMRGALKEVQLRMHDAGLLQEAEMVERSSGSTPYQMVRDKNKYDQSGIMLAADMANDPENLDMLKPLNDPDSGVRYWGAVGCIALGSRAGGAVDALTKALGDPSASVRIAAALALCKLDRCSEAMPVFKDALTDSNIWTGLQAADAMSDLDREFDMDIQRLRNKAIKKARNKVTVNALK